LFALSNTVVQLCKLSQKI